MPKKAGGAEEVTEEGAARFGKQKGNLKSEPHHATRPTAPPQLLPAAGCLKDAARSRTGPACPRR